jgi:hypothetical protein
VFNPTIKNALGFVQTAAGKQQLGYTLTIARPLLNLVEVAVIGDERLVGFLVGPRPPCAPL